MRSQKKTAKADAVVAVGVAEVPVQAPVQVLLGVAPVVAEAALVAVVLAQAVTAQGNSSHGSVMSVLEGTVLTLAGLAPWLFAGTAICLAVACYRGLPQCVRDLRDSLRFETGDGQRPAERTSYGSPLS